MTTIKKKNKWGKRTFTPEQWLRRDMRSAATRAEKAKRPITLPKLKVLEKSAEDE